MKHLLFFLFLLTGCTKIPELNVTTLKIDQTSLASFHTHCYDLALDSPPVGQKLLISWRLKENIDPSCPYRLVGTILLRNYEERSLNYTIDKPIDWLEYVIVAEEFEQTKGFLAYQIFLMRGEEVVELCQHPLFSEILHFPE